MSNLVFRHAFVAFSLLSASTTHAQTHELDANDNEAVETERAEPPNPVAGRVVAQSLTAIGAIAVPAAFGSVVSLYQLCLGSWSSPPCDHTPLEPIYAGVAVGALWMPAFVTLAGSEVHGRGNAGGAYLGFAAGAAVYGLVTAIALADEANSAELFSLQMLTAPLPIIGAIAGYEISDHSARRRTTDDWVSKIRPNIAYDGRTLMLSASGEF